MENNENEMKPQTGGLKLMTVFVFVLALHVVVIGGMTAYYVFRSGSAETETLADKSTHIKSESLPGEAAATEVTENKTPGVFTISQETLASTQSNSAPTAPVEPASTSAPESAPVATPAAPVEQPIVAETATPAVMPEAPAATAPVTEPVKNEVAATSEAIPAPAPPVVPVVPVTPIEFTPAPTPAVASSPVTPSTPAVASAPSVSAPNPVVTPTPPNLLPPPEPAKNGAPDAPRLVANATKSTLSMPEPVASSPTPTPATPAPVTVKPAAPDVAKTATASASKFVTIPVSKLDAATKKTTPEKTVSEKNVYTVKAHDSLEKIAHKNDITVAKLRAANSLNSDFLSIGQKLNIPSKSHNTAIVSTSTTATKAAKSVEKTAKNVEKTAEKTGKVAATTAKSTAAKSAKVATATPSKAKTYTVVKGDTLVKIARDYKTTPKALMAANGISDPTKLSIGKQLKIPSATKTTSAAKLKTPQLANNEQ